MCLVGTAAFTRASYQWCNGKLAIGVFVFPLPGAGYGNLAERYVDAKPELGA